MSSPVQMMTSETHVRVHVMSQAFPNVVEDLRRLAPDVDFVKITPPGREGLRVQTFYDVLATKLTPAHQDALKEAEYVVIDAHLLGQAMHDMPRAKWAHLTWAGIDRLVSARKADEPAPSFPVCRFSGKHFGLQMAEYAVWAAVAFERDLFRAAENQRKGEWTKDGRILSQRFIRDMTCGVLGVGMIGSHLANVFKVLGGKVIGLGLNHKKPEDVAFLDGYWTVDELDDFLAPCDVIVGILPSTPSTEGLLNAGKLASCRKQPLLINIGRGNLVSDEEIVRALDSGWIRGAVLDVFDPEPPPKTSPLWSHPLVHMTPHVAGTARSKDIAEQVVENLRLALQSRDPVGVIDWSVGY